MASKKPKLGRGLDVLLGSEAPLDLGTAQQTSEQLVLLSLDALKAGVYQPRTQIDEIALNDLAQSIRSQGVMQPILVRPLKNSGNTPIKYEIIAGERRYRAARLAELETIPAIIREVSDENAAVMALIENLQREDLNPLEQAQGVKRLLDEFSLTHEQAAMAIGRSRSATSNILRLLNLCEPVQTMLRAGDIDMGHARALLSLDAAVQIMIANEVVAKQLSVRDTEKRVGRYLREQEEEKSEKTEKSKHLLSADIQHFEKILSEHLGTTVKLKIGAKNKGNLQIAFQDMDHLNALLEKQGLSQLFQEK